MIINEGIVSFQHETILRRVSVLNFFFFRQIIILLQSWINLKKIKHGIYSRFDLDKDKVWNMVEIIGYKI